MLHISLRRYRTAALGIGLALTASAAALAQSRVVLPAGSVIIVRTTTPLQSASARTGQTFDTNVEESIGVDEYTVIPTGSRIRGSVTLATPATRQQSGVIEVVFDQLTLPNGTSFPSTASSPAPTRPSGVRSRAIRMHTWFWLESAEESARPSPAPARAGTPTTSSRRWGAPLGRS